MAIIDYIFIFITIFYSILGIIRGFANQLISFLSWILFIYLIFFHLKYFTDLVSSYITLDYIYIRMISIALLAVTTLLLIFILNLTVSKLLAATLFQNSNKIIGLLLSFIKSQIYIFIIILIMLDTPIKSDLFDNSYFMPYYMKLIEYISDYDDSLFNTFQI